MENIDIEAFYKNCDIIAEKYGKSFTYTDTGKDIQTLDSLVTMIHEDYKNNSLEFNPNTVAVSLGIFLGQKMLDTELSSLGFCWEVKGKEPVLQLNENNIMFPLTKVYKHIMNGPEDSVGSFYQAGLIIAKNEMNK